MTESVTPACRWCQRPIEVRPGPGRPREYCRRSCRQRDYEARRRAAERGLDEGEIIVARSRVAALQDRVWVLSCAVEDVDRDLHEAATAEDYRRALEWLLESARAVVATLERREL